MKVCIICSKEYWGNHSQGPRYNCDRCRRRFNGVKAWKRRNFRASNPYLVLADLLKKVIKIKQKQELQTKKAKQHAAYLRQKERKILGLVKRKFLKPRLGWF